MLTAAVVVVFAGWREAVYGAVSIVIGGTVWAGAIMILQSAFAAAPDCLGGRREIGKLRDFFPVGSGALGATAFCSLPMWICLSLIGYALVETNAQIIGLIGTGFAAMIAMLTFWTISVRRFLSQERREERHTRLATRLLAGTALGAMACAACAAVSALVVGDGEMFLGIMALCAPWLVGAAIALIGCRLYLRRLWVVRAPWYETHCAECGYDLSGDLGVAQCSECGTGWRSGAEWGEVGGAQPEA